MSASISVGHSRQRHQAVLAIQELAPETVSAATDRRFHAHRSLRRLGSVVGRGGGDVGGAGGGIQVLSWQPSQSPPRHRELLAKKVKKNPLSAIRSTAYSEQAIDEAELARIHSRQFLTLSGRSSAALSSATPPNERLSAAKQQRQQQQLPRHSASGADGLFLKPQTPVSVSRELRSSLLAYEDSGLQLKSFWMPEENLLNEETKTAKDQSAPLYRQRDLQQLTDDTGGPGGAGDAAGCGFSVRGTSGCVLVGSVPGSEARVGQNGRALNLRAAWSDTPELQMQRRLGYHARRLAGQPAETGVHLSWRSQLEDPAVKVIDCSSWQSQTMAATPAASRLASRSTPTAATASAAAAASGAAERESTLLSRVRGGSGVARSPLKASALFHAKRFSRALDNRFLSVAGEEPSLPVRYGDLLRCLQERPQQLLVVRSLFPAPEDEEGELAMRHKHSHQLQYQLQHQQQQQQQHRVPRLEKLMTSKEVEATATAEATGAAPTAAQSRQGSQQTSSVAAGKPVKKLPMASHVSPMAGRIATGRSLSKSAPVRTAHVGAADSGAGSGKFVPTVTALAGRPPRRGRDTAAKSAAAPAVIDAAADATARSISHADNADDDEDDAAAAAHPSKPLPSTPKGGPPTREHPLPEEARRLLTATVSGVEAEADDQAPESIRVPVMAESVAEDFDDPEDAANSREADAQRAVSRVSLTSTHISGFGVGGVAQVGDLAAEDEHEQLANDNDDD